jgi:hypothetical protein
LTHHEEFADPAVVPGPNLRSRFTDTEQVDDAVTEQLDEDGLRFCPSCHRVLPDAELVCPADGTASMVLPPPAAADPTSPAAESGSSRATSGSGA